MSNQTTFKSLFIDKDNAIKKMEDWLLALETRQIFVSENHGFAMAIAPVSEETNKPKMFRVAFSYMNKDETKFRPNVGAYLAYSALEYNGEYALMRAEMVDTIIESYDMIPW